MQGGKVNSVTKNLQFLENDLVFLAKMSVVNSKMCVCKGQVVLASREHHLLRSHALPRADPLPRPARPDLAPTHVPAPKRGPAVPELVLVPARPRAACAPGVHRLHVEASHVAGPHQLLARVAVPQALGRARLV